MADQNKNQNSVDTPAQVKPAATDFWGWISTAQQNVKQFAEVAGKVTQEKAALLVKQAEEMRQNYDMELATSILMGTVGGPVDPRSSVPHEKKLTRRAVQELDMTYVTENIISMSFPCDFVSGKGTQTGNDIDVVAAFLKKRHEGRFMIWNISEESYDYSKFADQVLEYKFPGHPSPPLGLLFKICTSVESWLDADERNIAVIHCLTGKGRTAALMACIMAWIGEFPSPMEALQYIADRRKLSVDSLTIPSQRRYIQYFSNMLDGVKPRSEPLLLRRVIINCIPVFGSDAQGTDGNLGCCPYVQLFKNGKLIATASAQGDSSGHPAESATEHNSESSHAPQKMQLRWIKSHEGSASFNVDCPVQGDILLRCRHVASSGVRVSMFRTGFHTGYVPSGVLRLTKAQLDGSSADPRFDEDFFVDLIFSPILPASNIAPEDINTSTSVPASDAALSTTAGGPAAGITDSGLVVEASSADRFEQTLHKDAKFWDSIANRKQKAKKRKSRKFLSHQQERFSIGGEDLSLDDPAVTEVNFYSSFTGDAGGKGSGVEGGGLSYSGLSDADLIMQLAELEGNSSAGDTTGSGGKEVALSSAGGSGFDLDADFLTDMSTTPKPADSAPAPTAASSSSSSTATSNSTTKKVSSELQVLEDLEKELGLDNFMGVGSSGAEGVTSGSAVKSRPAAPELSDDEDLDELEKYLQSLGNPK